MDVVHDLMTEFLFQHCVVPGALEISIKSPIPEAQDLASGQRVRGQGQALEGVLGVSDPSGATWVFGEHDALLRCLLVQG